MPGKVQLNALYELPSPYQQGRLAAPVIDEAQDVAHIQPDQIRPRPCLDHPAPRTFLSVTRRLA
ncbi:Uncharacterised protein [Escherichia coli]|nr:Uncharacterised protein [Escherichia coli]